MPTPHKHAALIKQFADDNSLAVWRWQPHHKAWFAATAETLFDSNEILAVGEKPTEPPPRMCTLAGIEFPAPLTVAPEVGTPYYVASMYRTDKVPPMMNWRGDSFGEAHMLELGLVHLDQAAAEAHGKALLAANQLAIREAS